MKQRMMKAMLMAAGLFAAAQAHALNTKWELGLGYDGGGDKLAEVTVDRQYSGSNSETVRAGQGGAFTLGAAFQYDETKQFETVASLGFKTGGPRAENGKVTFTSVPLTLVQFYRPSDVRLGMGVIYSMNPEFKADISNSKESVNYDDALGVVAQIGWAPLAQPYSIDLRYTSIKYQPKSASLNGVNYNTSNWAKDDGSTIGIYGSIRF